MKSIIASHVGANHLSPYEDKLEEARRLRAEIEAFQAAGGQIEKLGNTPLRSVIDAKAAAKGRKGGSKNKRMAHEAIFAKPQRRDILDEQDNVALQDAEEEDDELVEA